MYPPIYTTRIPCFYFIIVPSKTHVSISGKKRKIDN
jgi:hypothetical protein